MRFVTLFPKGSNVHLIKDVGQIPYMLKKEYGIEAVLVSNNIKKDGFYTENVQGLLYDRIGFKWLGWRIGSCLYLLMNAKKIDWLNIYHTGFRSLCWIKLFKWMNPRGGVYLKLDMDFRYCDKLDTDLNIRKTFRRCLNSVDMVSVETTAVLERIQKYTEKKIIVVPNGYIVKEEAEDPPNIEKKNFFLTVGRLGTRQKATEVLLEAFAKSAERQTWKLRLIGTVEEEFRHYLEKYFQTYPELKDRIEFVGSVNDRRLLMNQYKEAKIFILPSRWEGFPLVLPEAASQGCKMILTSAVPCCKDFVSEYRFGKIIPADNILCLADAMAEWQILTRIMRMQII